jgi:hypothetical protein
VATGKTLDNTLRRIPGAIELHTRGLREDGEPVPKPRQHTGRPGRTANRIDFYASVEVAA